VAPVGGPSGSGEVQDCRAAAGRGLPAQQGPVPLYDLPRHPLQARQEHRKQDVQPGKGWCVFWGCFGTADYGLPRATRAACVSSAAGREQTPSAILPTLRHHPYTTSTGWGLDYNTGKLFVQPNARSDSVAMMARGGSLNANSREILERYGMPMMGGFDYSVPLHVQHPAMRGTSDLDCIHYCHFGLPEVWTCAGCCVALLAPVRWLVCSRDTNCVHLASSWSHPPLLPLSYTLHPLPHSCWCTKWARS